MEKNLLDVGEPGHNPFTEFAPDPLRYCPHGVKFPADPAVMPVCDECIERQEMGMELLLAHRSPMFRKRELPRWMQH